VTDGPVAPPATGERGTDRSDSLPGAAGPVAPRPLRSARRRRRFGRSLEWGALLLAAVLLALGVRAFALETFYVPSSSMVPTLDVGDRILVDKFLFDYRSLGEGAIVVFARPPTDTMCTSELGDLVKRVIGLPGQTIWSVGNRIYVDGHVLNEPYLPADDPLGTKPIDRQTIPKDRYFVMGDNRAISCDSRYWGTIPGSSIVGRVVAVIWRNGHPDLHLY